MTCCFSNVRCVKDFIVVNDKVILDLNCLLFEIYHTVNRLQSFLSLGHLVTWSLCHSVNLSMLHN